MVRKRKVLVIFGTRPEAIKLAPVVHHLKTRGSAFRTIICVTAQHREILDQVLSLFEIKPDYDLNIMTTRQSLTQITVRAIEGLGNVIEKEVPDVVLVQGDTTTTFCGALAAFYHKIEVGHIEAGLRTDNKYAPFPEEINRRMTTQLTDYHFAPTEHARQSLTRDGIVDSSIFVTGNTVIDAMLWVLNKMREKPPQLPEGLDNILDHRHLVLVTCHRRESFGQGFENICGAIREVADAFPEWGFVYPVHLNPNVREPVNRILGGHKRIHLIEPLSYGPFVWLMDKAKIVLTDSGGVQEEAPSLGKPVLVMRENTERPEGIEACNARLLGVKKDSIINGLVELLECPEKLEEMAKVNNPYGDGHAAEKIVGILEKL